MSPDGRIRIEGLSKRLGDTVAVNGLCLEIEQGETFGLLGPNGAGKTTTLSLLATLLEPTEGDAQIHGHSLREEIAAVRRLVGLVPQDLALYPNLSAEENLRFFARLYGASLTRSQLDALLGLAGLGHRASDRVHTFSGGMKRRLNLVCGLVHEPKLLLLDEPTVGVDPQSRERIFEAVERIAGSGTTVIYTTHYMEEAERLCDRIAILDGGVVVAIGTLSELLAIVGAGEVIDLGIELPRLSDAQQAAIPGLRDLKRTNGRTRLIVESAARALGPLAGLVGEALEGESDLRVYPVDLARVFLHVTGREMRD
jgi:ABC-2 type transport system ATP-binding protein